MSDLERIMDKYPELRFWRVEVDNVHYHGHIEGDDVYINMLQPDYDWLRTALHECVHHEEDAGDCSNIRDIHTLKSEGWAIRESEKRYRSMFG